MVLRPTSIRPLLCALGGVCLIGCVSANERGFAYNADAGDATVPHDTTGPSPDRPVDMAPDTTAPPDTGDTTGPAPDMTATECTPRELGCTTDNRPRTCNEQGRWTVMAACAAPTACNAGVCLCPGNCAEDPLFETQTPGVIEDLVGGGRFLYLAVNGPQGSIRRFDLQARMETVVKSAAPDVGVFALDSDNMGNLLWCSDVLSSDGTRTGQLVHGTQVLDTGACTRVRRRDGFAYFKGDVVYRRPLEPGGTRDTVTRESLDKFEIAGDHLYFVDELAQEAVLKRLPLADTGKVETITRRPNTSFLRLLPDASHVYLISEGQILKVAQTAGAQAETFWQETAPEAWAMAQTDTHLYWSTTTTSGSMDCGEAQILRLPKAGGPVTTLSRNPGYCAGHLVRIGDVLYAAIWKGPLITATTRILRIRL